MNFTGRMLILAAIATLVGPAGCERQIQGDPVTHIEGVVRDAVTGNPVESVMVYWEDTLTVQSSYWPVHTDSAGAYSVGIWGLGRGSLYFLKAGYKTSSVPIFATQIQYRFDGVDIELTP